MEFLTQSHLTGQSSNEGFRKLHFLSMPIFFQGFFLFQFLVIIIFLNLSSNKAWCETTPEKTPGTKVGFIGGPYLPSKIPGVTEILQVAGVRIGSSSHFGNFEAETFIGNGSGINFQSLVCNYRLNVASDTLPVFALIGLHVDAFKKPDATTSSGGGWQIGGGAETKIAGPLYLRSDFEYRFGPGTSLLVLVSLMLAF